jgi:hypothetical protein
MDRQPSQLRNRPKARRSNAKLVIPGGVDADSLAGLGSSEGTIHLQKSLGIRHWIKHHFRRWRPNRADPGDRRPLILIK